MQSIPGQTEATRARIGLVGSGFIASGLLRLLDQSTDLVPSALLSRRPKDSLDGRLAELHTDSLAHLLESSDLVVECSGDVRWGADVIHAAMRAGKPVVTMGSEFHVTIGSWFVGHGGILTEAEGDQPGSLAALHEECLTMGFKPLVYGNIKGFLNHTPTAEDMEYWGGRQGISLPQVTSFTDGTKLQMEQAFVGNGLGADILRQGLEGPADLDLQQGGKFLGERAKALGKPIVDYLLNRNLPAGVFIVAEHPSEDPAVLRYFKLGDGPFYTILRPFHLCHLEAPRTIRRVLRGEGSLLNNSAHPTLGVCAIAKRKLTAGTAIPRATGGFDVRGEAARLADTRDAVPVGLLDGAVMRRDVDAGETVSIDDVDLPDCLATRAWHDLRTRI